MDHATYIFFSSIFICSSFSPFCIVCFSKSFLISRLLHSILNYFNPNRTFSFIVWYILLSNSAFNSCFFFSIQPLNPQNMLSWRGPTKIIDSNSWPCTGPPPSVLTVSKLSSTGHTPSFVAFFPRENVCSAKMAFCLSCLASDIWE